MSKNETGPDPAATLAQAGYDRLPTSWSAISVGDLLSQDRGISVGVMYPGDHDPAGIPLIKVGDLAGNRINPSPPFRISAAKHHEYRRTALEGGEILLTLVGGVGQCAIVPEGMRGWNAARAVAVLRLRKQDDAPFIRCCLLSRPLQHLMDIWCNTTVQATLNLKDIKRLPLPWPSPSERLAIANILGTLDDKIELNRRMNATLEAMARAIFQSWFVDFDPVKAKAAGAKRFPGMPQDLFDSLPATFVDSPLGPIPKGWEPTTLGDTVEILDSRRIPLSGQQRAERKGPYPYYGAAGVLDYVDEYLFDGIHVLMGEDGSVANDDDTPVVQYVWGQFWVNNHAHVLLPRGDVGIEHLHLFLRQLNIRPYITGAVQPKLNQGNLCRVPFLLPAASACRAFTSTASPLYAAYRSNVDQSVSLSSVRDALLPKLLSGEIRIPNTARIAGGGHE